MSRVTFDDFPTTPYSGPSLSLGTILNTKYNLLKSGVNGAATFRLDWSNSTPYVANDVVRSNGSFWIALLDNSNSVPATANTNWAKWQALSSRIASGVGSVSIDSATGTISALFEGDSINHQTILTVGVKTTNSNDFGFDIAAYRGGAGDGNRIIEIKQRNCTGVTVYDFDKYSFLGAPTFGDGYQGTYHTDTFAYVNYASNGPTGFRVVDRNTGKTRCYFSGGVQMGADTMFSAATTLTIAHYACYFDTSAGSINQPLPDATGQDGRVYVFFKGSSDANTLTIAPLSGQGASTTLTNQDSTVTYRAFNGKWRRVSLLN